MRSLLLAALTVGIVAASAPADDSPRAIIEKAVKATGGAELLSRPLATHFKMRGTVPINGKDSFPFTGEIYTQPNGDFKYSLQLKANEQGFKIVMALVGDKGWQSLDGALENLDAARLAELKLSRYYDRVTSLVPLLKDRSYTLSSIGAMTVRGAVAVGVKVTAKDQPDIKLYFDKASGLLVKTEYRAKSPGQDKEMRHEMVFSDWRVPDAAAADEQLVKAAKLKTDGPALVDYLRKHTPVGGDTATIKQLVKQLGDDDFDTREKASKALIALGAAALPYLREAAERGDTEVKRRAKECLKQIGPAPDDKTVPAVVRLVGWRKPPGAAEVLLDWAARLADDPLGREVRSALAGVAIVNGKPDETLVKALEDKDPARKAAAAAALGRDGGQWAKNPGRRLYLTGIKFPMKAVQSQNGTEMLKREYTDVQLFNRFDDSVLARPK